MYKDIVFTLRLKVAGTNTINKIIKASLLTSMLVLEFDSAVTSIAMIC